MKLSSIISQVSSGKLKPNNANRQYFTRDDGKEITALEKDIQKRGIQVPLVAKQDGTLLAGHRRLLVAKKNGMKKVPVQYVVGKITPQEELEFLIKDNLLRRQLTPAEREALYRALYTDFDERILMTKGSLAITAKDVAKKTGLNKNTVGYDLNRMRHKRKREIKKAVDNVNVDAVDRFKKSVARMLNDAQVENAATVREFVALARLAMERLESMQQLRKV
jgi:ParB-like chromosome segregation protein Spo0J